MRNWRGYFSALDRPYRWGEFLRVADRLSDREYWDILGDIYNGLECPPPLKELRRLLKSRRPERHHIMNTGERAYFSGLPETLKVYRGFSLVRRARGWSWTLSERRACWFAERFSVLSGTPRVATGILQRTDAIAYFGRRGEREIVVDPRKVRVVAIEMV